MNTPDRPGASGQSFAEAASRPSQGLVRELWSLIKSNKKWWLIPVLAILLALGALTFLASTGAAPFIYTLF